MGIVTHWLFARNERGPGFTIYTCPRCGGERHDGMKCLTPLTYPAEWLLDIFNGGRTDSLHNDVRFREAMTGARVFHQPVPSAPERAWLKEMKIAWEGGE